MSLRRARKTEISELMGWFDTATSCTLWGGPSFEFPYTTDTFYRDLKWSSIKSFSWVNDNGKLIGFGQLYEKLGRTHLARLVVNPNYRGKGFGTRLLHNLIEEGARIFSHDENSLYVDHGNTTAISCYQSAGFRSTDRPEEDKGFEDCLFMVLKRDTARH